MMVCDKSLTDTGTDADCDDNKKYHVQIPLVFKKAAEAEVHVISNIKIWVYKLLSVLSNSEYKMFNMLFQQAQSALKVKVNGSFRCDLKVEVLCECVTVDVSTTG